MILGAVVLAAGKGTRMNSALPKVLHPLAGRPMIGWVLESLSGVEIAHTVVVIGHGADAVAVALPDGVTTQVQDQQLGTGHATAVGLAGLPESCDTVLVLCGDTPLVSGDLISGLVAAHQASGHAATMVTTVMPEAGCYGRVIRDASGAVTAVVEARHASAVEREVREINAGIFMFDRAVLSAALARVGSSNAQGEVYLPDVLPLMGASIGTVITDDPDVVLGVNTLVDLAIFGGQIAVEVLLVAAVLIVVVTSQTQVEARKHLTGDRAFDFIVLVVADRAADFRIGRVGRANVDRVDRTGGGLAATDVLRPALDLLLAQEQRRLVEAVGRIDVEFVFVGGDAGVVGEVDRLTADAADIGVHIARVINEARGEVGHFLHRRDADPVAGGAGEHRNGHRDFLQSGLTVFGGDDDVGAARFLGSGRLCRRRRRWRRGLGQRRRGDGGKDDNGSTQAKHSPQLRSITHTKYPPCRHAVPFGIDPWLAAQKGVRTTPLCDFQALPESPPTPGAASDTGR